MWEFTTGKKPFHYKPHNHYLILNILKGERPQITDDTPEFYAELMKRCWGHNPENRPTAEEICDCLEGYWDYNRTKEKKEIIKLAEAKRQEIIKSEKFLIDTKNYKHHPESFYTSRLLNESIQQAESLLNLSSTEIQMNNSDCDNKNGSSDKKNYKSSGFTQQIEPLLNLSSTEIESGSKTHYIDEGNDDNNGSIKKKSKIFHK